MSARLALAVIKKLLRGGRLIKKKIAAFYTVRHQTTFQSIPLHVVRLFSDVFSFRRENLFELQFSPGDLETTFLV
jgi:hypothetical protein